MTQPVRSSYEENVYQEENTSESAINGNAEEASQRTVTNSLPDETEFNVHVDGGSQNDINEQSKQKKSKKNKRIKKSSVRTVNGFISMSERILAVSSYLCVGSVIAYLIQRYKKEENEFLSLHIDQSFAMMLVEILAVIYMFIYKVFVLPQGTASSLLNFLYTLAGLIIMTMLVMSLFGIITAATGRFIVFPIVSKLHILPLARNTKAE